jgi:putative selenium metabolism hydrolase
MDFYTIADVVKEVKAASNALFDKQTQFLADIIAIRSYTGHELPAVERMLKELKAIGCEETWMDTAGNALGKIGHGKKLILYNAHLDTNEVADEKEWPHPPLQPTVENGAMWGLGASDCKGGVAAIVYGAAILKALHLEGDFTLLVMGATLEEDAEGFALRSLVERDGVHPNVVLLAEATDLSLRRGQRGRCEIQVRTNGKAAHASQPQLGENAILKMLPVMQALDAMNPTLPDDPIFGKANQVISMIQGPHTPNSVPSWCELTIDRRMVPGETMDSIMNSIRAVVEPLGATAKIPNQVVKTHTGKRLDGPSFYPGWLLEEEAPLISTGFETCRALWGKTPELDVWHFSTDGTYSAGVAGIPTLGFGPEEEKYVHAATDQVNLEKLRKAAEFYALFPVMFDRS